jgi:hypothetical protein
MSKETPQNPFPWLQINKENQIESKVRDLDLKILRKLVTELSIDCTESEEREFMHLITSDRIDAALTNNDLSPDEVLRNSEKLVGGRIAEFILLLEAKKYFAEVFASMEEKKEELKTLKETSIFISGILYNYESLSKLIKSISDRLSKKRSLIYKYVLTSINISLQKTVSEDLNSSDRDDAQEMYQDILREINGNREINEIVSAILTENQD